MKYKYPRTFHLPWSEGATNDDKVIKDTSCFLSKEVVVTIKYDGENTTLGSNYIHARSLDSKNHPSRNWLKSFHAQFSFDIPPDMRICGENLYAKHSIYYKNLESYFLAFSIWCNDVCYSWNETKVVCEMLGIKMVKEIYRGEYLGDAKMKTVLADLLEKDDSNDIKEGYVIRLADAFHYKDFCSSVAKFVRKNHVQTDAHWMHQSVVPNLLKNTY